MNLTINTRAVAVRLVALATLGLAANSASALGFTELYVFGDSLSDTGNITSATTFPQAPYFNGRFSNGANWVDGLAAQLGLSSLHSQAGGTNYAWGGAVTGPGTPNFPPTLLGQLDFYFNDSNGLADEDALYIVWGGGNDVRANNSANAAGYMADVVSQLADAGARNFLVVNLPDIGQTPESLAGMAPGGDAALMSQLTLEHNAALAAEMASLSASDPALNIVSLDVFAIFNAVLANPAAFGITNTTDACWVGDFAGTGTQCANPDEYVFWDGIHPTAYTHGVLADAAYRALVPIPAALPLLVSGLAMLGFAGRRRRAA